MPYAQIKLTMQPIVPHTCWNRSDVCISASIFVIAGFEPMVKTPYRPNNEKMIRNQAMIVIESGRFMLNFPVKPSGQTSAGQAERNALIRPTDEHLDALTRIRKGIDLAASGQGEFV